MGCDTKIHCKALAKRLETSVTSLITNDQNGFVLGRQAFHNILRDLNILYESVMLKIQQSCRWMLKKPLTGLNGNT